jgi:hypothetical protein
MIKLSNVHDIVSYHAPDQSGLDSIQLIRNASEAMITTILNEAPPCADQTVAVRKVREAMMWANAAIALKGAV